MFASVRHTHKQTSPSLLSSQKQTNQPTDDGQVDDCNTLEKICGGKSCKVSFQTAKFKPTPSSASITCCSKASNIPIGCASGMGAMDDGFSPCTQCATGSVSAPLPDAVSALPKCTACPPGKVPDNTQGACGELLVAPPVSVCVFWGWVLTQYASKPAHTTHTPLLLSDPPSQLSFSSPPVDTNRSNAVDACPAGTGGNPCTECERGTFSTGGASGNPTAACQPCKKGFTTITTGARSDLACSIRMCAPGQGGLGCGPCPYNTFSAGGTLDNPFKDCEPCPTGSFTASMSTRSASDCSVPVAPSCSPGYFSGGDGACHICPPNSYSEGGLTKVCELCPAGTVTKGFAAGSKASCQVPEGRNDMSGAYSWTADEEALYSEQCRKDLAEFFNAPSFDRRLGAVLRYDAGSCRATEAGFAEMQVFYHSRVLEGSVNELFKIGTPGRVSLDWWQLGVADYEAMFGTGIKKDLAQWNDVPKLEGIFSTSAAKYNLGPIYAKLVNATVDAQSTALSFVSTAMREREDDAYTRFNGAMTDEGTHMWLLLRKLREALELLIPGLRPEGTRPTGTIPMVELVTPAQLAGRRKLLQSTIYPLRGLGLIQIDVNDKLGRYRNLVCGTGVFEDTLERASQMAINGWEYGAYCKNWPGTEGAEDVEVTFSKFTDDKAVADSLKASLELSITAGSVSLSGGAKYASENLAKDNGVTIMQNAVRMRAPPLALPEEAPDLTPTAQRILLQKGEAEFRKIYGTHFIVGWRLGGFLNFAFTYFSNEQVSAMEINGNLKVEVMGKGGGSASVDFKKDNKFASINVKSAIKTNTRLPVDECGALGIGTEPPTNDQIAACVLAWLKADGGASAAYQAYAVPYIYHPTYAEIIEANATDSGGAGRRLLGDSEFALIRRALLQSPPQQSGEAAPVDYKFKETGLLQTRVNSIGKILDQYKFKDDKLYFNAMKTLEEAQAIIDSIFERLRSKNITGVQDWQVEYNKALGKVNLASSQSKSTPLGARCGWCTKVSKDNRQGQCSSTCTSTKDCKVSCPIPYFNTTANNGAPWPNPYGPFNLSSVEFKQKETDCSYSGFVYSTFVNETGTSIPTCETAITGPVCAVFGSAETDDKGSYYCFKQTCNWHTEWCDGEVERDESKTWACVGTCRPRVAAANSSCYCQPQTIGNDTLRTGIYPPDSSTDKHCFFGERLDKYMWEGGDGVQGNASVPTPGYWSSRGSFEQTIGGNPISLYSVSPFSPIYLPENTGYDTAKSAFLTTDCPVVTDTVWIKRAGAPGAGSSRRLLGTDSVSDADGYDKWEINSCACSKVTGKWVGSYMQSLA